MREEFNWGEDSEGLWYVAIENEQIVWDLTSSQAERVCAQLKASDAKYQAIVRKLEEALQYYADGGHFMPADETEWESVSGEPENVLANCTENGDGLASVENGYTARQALLPTTPDTALHRKVLAARIHALNEMTICMIDRRDKIVLLQQIDVLRAQLAALGE